VSAVKNRSTPLLRFPEFTEDWKSLPMTKIAKIGTGKKDTQDKDTNGKYPFYVRSDTVEKINSYGYDGVAILTSGDGVGVGKNFHYVNGKFDYHQRVYAIRDFINKADSRFVYEYFSANFYKRVIRLSAKNSVDSIRMTMIADMPIPIPDLSEQKKIAEFLTLVVERIELIGKKIELSKAYKKGLMQKLFPAKDQTNPTLRFKKPDGSDFPDWHTVSLSELLEYEQPTSYIVQSVEYDDTYGTPVLTAGKTFILGYTNEKNGIKDASSNPVIIFDDFTTASHFVDFNFKVKSSAMKILKQKAETPMKLTYELLNQINYEVGDHKRHWIGEYQNLPVKLPFHIKEQEKIADFLSSIDEKIKEQERKLEQAKEFKKALLQQMFV